MQRALRLFRRGDYQILEVDDVAISVSNSNNMEHSTVSSVNEYRLVPAHKNRDLIESYNFTTLRSDIGLYGQRILLRLVEAANNEGAFQGLDFRHDDCRKIERDEIVTNLFGRTIVTIPAKSIMGTSEEYTKLKSDIKKIIRYIVEINKGNGNFKLIPFFQSAEYKEGSITVEISSEIWNELLDFTRGFRKFELNIALSLTSKYSLRIYKLISGQTEPLTYSVKELKEMLGLSTKETVKIDGKKIQIIKEKYKDINVFTRKVIEPARLELNQFSPYTFSYKFIYSEKVRKGRPAVSAIQFIPIFRPKYRDENLHQNDLVNKHSGAFNNFGLTKEQINFLKEKFELTDKGIENNYRIWNAFNREDIDLTDILDRLSVRVSNERPQNPQRFVIGTLKSILKQYGISV